MLDNPVIKLDMFSIDEILSSVKLKTSHVTISFVNIVEDSLSRWSLNRVKKLIKHLILISSKFYVRNLLGCVFKLDEINFVHTGS